MEQWDLVLNPGRDEWIMHVSVRTLYALRTVVELAEEPDSPSHARELASQRYINENYLVEVLTELRHAGIVSTKKGPRGGYRLDRSPEKISLGEVIKAMEGPTFVSPCTQPEHSDCEIVDDCSIQSVLAAVAAGLEELMDEITIEQIRRQSTVEDEDVSRAAASGS